MAPKGRISVQVPIKVIEIGDKVVLTKDLYPGGDNMIEAGTVFFICPFNPHGNRSIITGAISGFGPNLITGVQVTQEDPKRHHSRWPSSTIIVPLDWLQLAE